MKTQTPTKSFAFDDFGLWDLRGDFAAPIKGLGESKDGIGVWPLRAAVETSASIPEIHRAFMAAFKVHGITGLINWPLTLRKMNSERARILRRLARDQHRKMTNTNPHAGA